MDMTLLEQKIVESGYRREFIAEKLGLTRFGFRDKINNPDRWKVSEVRELVKLLNISKADSRKIFGI